MKRAALAAAALALAAAALALVLMPTAAVARGPDPNAQAVADGCARETVGLSLRQVPEWVYVGDAERPATGPPPPLRSVAGIVGSRYDRWEAARPAGIDNPFTHLSYDEGIDVLPGGPYRELIGGDPRARTGNYAGRDDETARLHLEWEQGALPLWAWPDPGDRIAATGAWIWDCGHFGSGERTELHPLQALWVARRGLSVRSRRGESEGDLVIADTPTPAFRQEQCAHRTKGNRVVFTACVLGPGAERPAVAGTYRFALSLPPRPSSRARATVRVAERGSRGAFRFSVRRRGTRVAVVVRIGRRPNVLVAKQVFAGWSVAPRLVHLRLRLRRLHVRGALDPSEVRSGGQTMPPGEWLAYVDAGGSWRMWRPRVRLVDTGQTIRLHDAFDLYVRPGGRWRLAFFTRECDYGAAGSAYSRTRPIYPCPRTSEFGNLAGDDVPGAVVVRAGTRSVARRRVDALTEDSTCPPRLRHGCFWLEFSIARVR